jgi:hypothetical protein
VRRAAKIDTTHRPIVEGLRAIGAHVVSLAAIGGGIPDLLVSHRNRWHLLECKRPLGPRGGSSADGQHLRATQERFKSAARAPVHVVRSLEDALEAIGATRKAAQEARS